ncbi:hypothetical protein Syn19_015 [Synechococcus phage Syn19]|uniref:Lysozyme murein n=1 Tax=Synechococcus phage Syn19 TaxID=445684 RepID=E3SPY5_9CAUD|nr:hypothetical protein Syn19_015 [Synechococcus phage Syn19]ADO99537.1 hypothetical protein Syn19_015 [Synechococcus phage Syn19]
METKTVNIYKVIPTTGISNISFGRGMTGAVKKEQKKSAKLFASQLQGINQIGLSLNGISKTLDNIRRLQVKRLKALEKERIKDSFEARYTKNEKVKGSFAFSSGVLGRVAPDFFGGLMGFLGGLIKYLVLRPILEWLADENNQQKIISFLEGLKKILDFFTWLVSSSIVNLVDGLYDLLRDDATPWERLTGFLKAFGIIGAAFIGLSFLKNPRQTINAFRNVFTNFNKNLTDRHNRLKQQTARGKPVATTGGGKKPVKVKPNTKPVRTGPLGAIRGALGGIRGRRGRSEGGYIDGPMGGYPVTLDGKGVDFIGHGREFVAQKPGGDAFVIPFETPDTIKNPGLTSQRINEALKGGFNLKEMSSGGWINGPESGYLASMSGHRPDFIGHGLEYISKDSVGNSMVIPFNSSGMTRANMELAHMAGFKLPDRLPSSTAFNPGGYSTTQGAGKDGMFLGSIGKAIGGLFGGGKKSSSSSGGGGGGFFGNIVSGIGNLFGGGGQQQSSSSSYAPDLRFGGFGKSNPFLMGQDYSYAQQHSGLGNLFGVSREFEKDFTFGGGSSAPKFNFGNIFGGGEKRYRSGDETSGMGPLANGTQYAAMVTGNKLFGFDYNQGGGVKGGLGGIIKGLSKQGGALGSMIGGLFGAKGTGNAIGNLFQTILGGGGSNEDGSASWYDVIRGGAGVAFNFLKGKKIFGRDAQDFINGATNIGDLLFKQDGKTFGEKLPELVARGLHLFGKQNLMGGKLPHLLAVAMGQASPMSLLTSGQQKMLGGLAGAAQGTDQYGMEGATGEDGQIALDGAGPNKAKEIGQDALTRGLTVFNNRFFRRNNWSEEGPNSKGFSPGGREPVSGNPVHQMGLAIDIASYQGDKDKQKSAMQSFAESLYSARQNLKLQSIMYNDWGAWQYGKKRKSPGNYGIPHLHVAVAKAKVANPLGQEAATGEGGGSSDAGQGGMSQTQYQAAKRDIESQGLGGLTGGTLGGFGSTKFMNLIKNFSGLGGNEDGGPDPTTMRNPFLGGGGAAAASANFGGGSSAPKFRMPSSGNKGGGYSPAGKSRGMLPVLTSLAGGRKNGGGVSEHGMQESSVSRLMTGSPLMELFGSMGTNRNSGAPLAKKPDEENRRNKYEIMKVTRERAIARAEMNRRSQQTVQQTMAAVEQANAQVRASVAAAQSAIANIGAGQGSHGGAVGGSGNRIAQSVGSAMSQILSSGMNKGGGLFA